MNIKNTQEFAIEKSGDGYIVRRYIYAMGLMSAPVQIHLPSDALSKKYKNYGAYCRAINRLIHAELNRIASENFKGL